MGRPLSRLPKGGCMGSHEINSGNSLPKGGRVDAGDEKCTSHHGAVGGRSFPSLKMPQVPEVFTAKDATNPQRTRRYDDSHRVIFVRTATVGCVSKYFLYYKPIVAIVADSLRSLRLIFPEFEVFFSAGRLLPQRSRRVVYRTESSQISTFKK
jgi:hypothetical protein